MLLIIVGTIPCFIIKVGIIDSYEKRAVSLRTQDIQTQLNILGNQMISNDYLEHPNHDVINGELSQLANFYDGRIRVINENFKIVKDTFSLDEEKIAIPENVMLTFQGKNTDNYNKVEESLELTIPIKDLSTDKVMGVLLANVSTESIMDSIDILNSKANVLVTLVISGILIIAYFLSLILVKPFGSVTKSIEALTDGYSEGNIEISAYTETSSISEAFNKLLARMKVLDDSRQEFVSNVSHELKTPLTSMKVLADSLLAQEDTPVELYREFMVDITEEIERESIIITDLLALVKMDKKASNLNIESRSINELLELILKRLRPIAEKQNIELVFESFRLVAAEVDEVKLTLAFSNLVENAIKYNVENGWVHVSLNADHKYFYVKVADSGIGIPEEDTEHIFERFFRVDKSHSREIGGTGLGLAIARNAILMHRGAIKVYSKEGEGTTFTVRVPLIYIT